MERSVSVRYRVIVDDAKAKSKELGDTIKGVADKAKAVGPAAKQGFSDLLDYADRNSASLNTLSAGIGLVGAGLVGMAALAVKKFADFDQAMSNVIATGDDARDSQDALREAAIQAGASTVFSATEAAGAIEEMAKAGVTATDILSGGLDGALDLAAAGSLEVADAAGIAATVMNQFSLEGREVTRIADVLAASAGKANGEVADFGLAMKYVGPVSSQLGVSLEETSGALAYLAQNGLLADSAGTGLRGVLMSLTAPTKAAQKAMDDYGISAFDAQGEFVGLESLAGQLQTQLAGLTEAERSAALGRMFGNEQITTARILMKGGAEDLAYWTAQVDDSGYAAETAAAKLDNLKGDWEALTGAIDTALIQGGSGANDMLRGLVQGAESAVDAIGQLPEPILQTTTLLTGAGGLALLGVAGLMKLTTSIAEAKSALETLKISAGTAKAAVAGVAGVLAIGTLAFAAWADSQAQARERTEGFMSTLDELGNRTDATTRKVNEALASTSAGFLEWGPQESLIEQAERFGVATEDLQGYILGQADAMDRVTAATKAYAESQGPEGTSMNRAAIKETGDFTTALDQQASSLTEAEKVIIAKAEADRVAGLESEKSTEAVEQNVSALEAYNAEVQTGTETTEGYVDALTEMIEAQREAAGIVLSVRDAQRNFEDATAGVSEALETQIDELARQREEQGYGAESARAWAEEQVNASDKLDITTEAGRRNQAALDEVADSGWGLLESMQANNATQGELQAQMQTTRDRFIAAAESMGMSAEEASLLADELGLIPENVNVEVAAETAAARTSASELIAHLDGLRATVGVSADTSAAQMAINRLQNQDRITLGVGAATKQARGGLWDGPRKSFANGGVNALGQMVPRTPQIVAGGANILWGEPETGWEAYISGKPSELARNREIHAEAGRRLGVESVPLSARYAVGGFAGTPVPSSTIAGPSVVLNTPVDAFMAAADQIAREMARQQNIAARRESTQAYSAASADARVDLDGQAVRQR